MTLKRLLIIILLAAAALYFLLPNDEKILRKNLTSLADACSSPAKETAIPALQKVLQAGKLCSDPCTIQIESFRINHNYSKKELTDHIFMLKKMTPGTHFSFHDTEITFPKDARAEIACTLRLDGKIKDQRFTDAYELNVQAEKINGDWLFSSFTVVEFMEQ